MTRRLGVSHLFLKDQLERHTTWTARLTSSAFFDALESAAKSAAKKHGALQVVRFLRNAFVVPSRFNGSMCCSLCNEPSSEFNLRHIVACGQFNVLLKSVLPAASADLCERALGGQSGTNSHMLVRLLLAFPKQKSMNNTSDLTSSAQLGAW